MSKDCNAKSSAPPEPPAKAMTQIDFHFNVGNRLLYACYFVKKVWKLGKSIAVWSSDPLRLSGFDRRLGAFEDMAFSPHAFAGALDSDSARVILASDPTSLPDSDVLLLLDESVPPDYQKLFNRFDRIVDIVSSIPSETEAARSRYRIYRDNKYPLKAYDQKRH